MKRTFKITKSNEDLAKERSIHFGKTKRKRTTAVQPTPSAATNSGQEKTKN